MLETLKDVDLSKIVELDDNTDLSGELACAGGACEIKWLDIWVIHQRIYFKEKNFEN